MFQSSRDKSIYEMPELNPYESPQLIERDISSPRLDDSLEREYLLSPEWKSVCRGARYCYIAVIAIFGSIVFAMFIAALTGAFDVGKEVAVAFGTYLFLGSLLLGWVYHWVGLFKLQKISYPETAGRYFTQSIITFFLLHTLLLLAVIWMIAGRMQNNAGEIHYMLIGAGAGMFALYMTHTFTMLLGLREVGRFLQDEIFVSNATSAYYTVAVMIVIEALTLIAIVSKSFVGFRAMEVVLMIVFVLGNGIAVAYYANAMKQFALHAEEQHGEIETDEEDD